MTFSFPSLPFDPLTASSTPGVSGSPATPVGVATGDAFDTLLGTLVSAGTPTEVSTGTPPAAGFRPAEVSNPMTASGALVPPVLTDSVAASAAGQGSDRSDDDAVSADAGQAKGESGAEHRHPFPARPTAADPVSPMTSPSVPAEARVGQDVGHLPTSGNAGTAVDASGAVASHARIQGTGERAGTSRTASALSPVTPAPAANGGAPNRSVAVEPSSAPSGPSASEAKKRSVTVREEPTTRTRHSETLASDAAALAGLLVPASLPVVPVEPPAQGAEGEIGREGAVGENLPSSAPKAPPPFAGTTPVTEPAPAVAEGAPDARMREAHAGLAAARGSSVAPAERAGSAPSAAMSEAVGAAAPATARSSKPNSLLARPERGESEATPATAAWSPRAPQGTATPGAPTTSDPVATVAPGRGLPTLLPHRAPMSAQSGLTGASEKPATSEPTGDLTTEAQAHGPMASVTAAQPGSAPRMAIEGLRVVVRDARSASSAADSPADERPMAETFRATPAARGASWTMTPSSGAGDVGATRSAQTGIGITDARSFRSTPELPVAATAVPQPQPQPLPVAGNMRQGGTTPAGFAALDAQALPALAHDGEAVLDGSGVRGREQGRGASVQPAVSQAPELRENFASARSLPRVSPHAPRSLAIKPSVVAEGEVVTKASAALGIDSAKAQPAMSSLFPETLSPLEVAPADAGMVSRHGATERTTPAATAERAVEAVLAASERAGAGERSSVTLQFDLHGNPLDVRVVMRGGEVQTTFNTASPELRAALQAEWAAVSESLPAERAHVFTTPVFSANDSNPAASGGGDPGARQRPFEAPPERAASVPAPRPVAETTAETLPARLAARTPTAHHLHTLA